MIAFKRQLIIFEIKQTKMKKQIILSIFVIISLNAISQKNEHSCSNLKSKINLSKSASLTVAQIAQTERYNVHYYTLDVEMSNLSTDIAGTGEIYGTANEALDTVWFELFNTFTITEIRLNGLSTPYLRQGSAIKVPVNILAGDSFIISTDYQGTPPTAATNPLGGAGMTNDNSPSWGNQVTWSLSEPFSAYEWWPCKQSLRDKADSVSVKITVPSSCKAGSNGVLENVVDLGNGKSRYEWKHRHPIDYYLVSVAIAEYVEYNVYANPIGATNPILIQNFIYNNPQTLPYFQADIDETVDFLELYSDVFGLYPFADEKYGHCMAPLGGGMEHQTMTTQGFFEKTLTSHELAHQWFGDKVTCASWADIWVNEGFASYAEYIMLENLYPSEEITDMVTRHDNIMQQPGGSVWVLDSLNEGAIFSSRLVYDKGAAIIHTMRFLANDDALFFQGIENYLTEFSDSVAIGLDVKTALENATGVDYTANFEEWYFGEGFPTYSVVWNKIGSDLQLKITHSTSRPNVTPTFTNPLEIRFSRTFLPDTTIRFDIQSNDENFVIQNMSSILNVSSVDPNNWIINRVGSIVYDNAFMASNEELSNEELIEIFPNPNNGLFTISVKKPGSYKVDILDTKGRIIAQKNFDKNIQLDLTKEVKGLYLLQITSVDGSQTIRKIVKN